MADWRYPGLHRDSVTIAAATMVTAFLAAYAALASTHLSLSPRDHARDVPFFGAADPFVQGAVNLIASLGALAAFPCAWLILVGTDLKRTIPPAAIATVLVAFVSGFVGAPEAVLATLVGGVLALMLVRLIHDRCARGARTPDTSASACPPPARRS
jgi:hypothetical protein